jgi:hypothetical protein
MRTSVSSYSVAWFARLTPSQRRLCARSPLGSVAVRDGLPALRAVLLDAFWRTAGNFLAAARLLDSSKPVLVQWVTVLGLGNALEEVREQSRGWFRALSEDERRALSGVRQVDRDPAALVAWTRARCKGNATRRKWSRLAARHS